jgi:hypothetical protein
MKPHLILKVGAVSILLIFAGLVAACNFLESDTAAQPSVRTWLLVSAPDGPLPLNRPINVRSRTQDGQNLVSHVELYAVQLPSGEANVLIRSDAAPFQQTSFTASQVFVPTQPGHYVIKVVGYNRLGQSAESDFIGFDVIENTLE